MIYPTLFLEYIATIEALTRLTSLRKRILFILWTSDKPLKAYELLHSLQQSKQNSTPPTVYRVLDYLVDFGIVHKIESIQSYTLCREPKKHLPSEILMVCTQCNKVCEAHDSELVAMIRALAAKNSFALGQDVIELKGICFPCEAQSST